MSPVDPMRIAGNHKALTASRSSVPPYIATLPGQEVSRTLRGYGGGRARGAGVCGRWLKRGGKILRGGRGLAAASRPEIARSSLAPRVVVSFCFMVPARNNSFRFSYWYFTV